MSAGRSRGATTAGHRRGVLTACAGAALAAALATTSCGGGGGGGGGTSSAAASEVACLRDRGCRRVDVVAHRGNLYFAPENTVAAAALSIERFGARWVEADLRRTRDGVVVLMHDADVDRTTTGFGAVADLTLADLGGLVVLAPDQRGGLTSPEALFIVATGLTVLVDDPQPIPTLDDLVRATRGRAALLLDLAPDPAGAEQVVRQILALDVASQVVLVADNVETAARVRGLGPGIPLAVAPESLAEHRAFERALGGVELVRLSTSTSGFASIRDAVRGAGGKVILDAVGDTDDVASLAEAQVRQGGGSRTDALAAGRLVYQLFLDQHAPDLVVSDRVDLLAPFVEDYNLAAGR